MAIPSTTYRGGGILAKIKMNLSIDWTLLLIGIIELLLTIIVSVLVVFIGFKAFSVLTREYKEVDELKNNNIAVGIISASIIISMAILIKAAIDPSITTMRLLIKGGVSFPDILLTIAFFLMFFVITGLIAIVVIFLSSAMYNKLTKKINEYTEIKNNNIAIAIVFSAVIIAISFLVQEGVSAIVAGLQPWPEAIKNDAIPTKVGFLIYNLRNFIGII